MNLNYDLLSLSVNMQAQAMLPVVVNILGLFDENGCFEKVSARITPLYNGRERGYVLTLSTNALIPHDPPPLHVFFAEDRHSDALFVWSWEAPVLEVPPRLPNDFDQSFMARRSVPWLRLDLAQAIVHDIVGKWLDRATSAMQRLEAQEAEAI